MQITKYEHACLDLLEGNSRLIIDPCVYTNSLVDLKNVTAVVITHVNQDHFDSEKIQKIIEQNTGVHIFSTQEVCDKINASEKIVVHNGLSHEVGDFNLEFFGEQHATIGDSYPAPQTTGVLVDGKLYYPGDSPTTCPKPNTDLAVPTMAPWLK